VQSAVWTVNCASAEGEEVTACVTDDAPSRRGKLLEKGRKEGAQTSPSTSPTRNDTTTQRSRQCLQPSRRRRARSNAPLAANSSHARLALDWLLLLCSPPSTACFSLGANPGATAIYRYSSRANKP
jgi:hypothetical protein